MQKVKEVLKNKIKLVHIIVIILGIAFISLANFHRTIWFDESYSVAISAHSFSEIWTIGGHDVHPVLYYWLLHILRYIFGNEILAYRLFSVLAISILGILGYTHIRKDFGEKVGLIFSILVFFMPITLVYSGEIRMYALAMLLTTLTAIYAYRIYKNSNEKNTKNWILFGIFSLASAYTHYYSLVASGVINLLLFIYLLKNAVKEKKFTANLKRFIASTVIQISLYIPWLIYLLLQIEQVSAGFWIEMEFPKTLQEMFLFQFTGNLDKMEYVPEILGYIFGGIICAYLVGIVCVQIVKFIKKRKSIELDNDKSKKTEIKEIKQNNKENQTEKEDSKQKMKPVIYAFLTYALVLILIWIVSLIMPSPILYARYMLCITGLFIFGISYLMAKYGNKYINICILILIIAMSTYINVNLIKTNYDESNSKPMEYIQENVEESDILVYGNDAVGFVVSANLPEIEQYFYDGGYWNVEEAYKAFGPNMTYTHNLDMLEGYTGRIWAINSNNYAIADEIVEKYDAKIIEQVHYTTEYKEKYEYTFSLLEMK